MKASLFGMQIEYLLNTGNLVSNNTLDLSQNTGFTVVAEKLNFFRWAPVSLDVLWAVKCLFQWRMDTAIPREQRRMHLSKARRCLEPPKIVSPAQARLIGLGSLVYAYAVVD